MAGNRERRRNQSSWHSVYGLREEVSTFVCVKGLSRWRPSRGRTTRPSSATPIIRARTQAVIRVGGEQGRAAVSRRFLAGGRACGLSWSVPNERTDQGIRRGVWGPPASHLQWQDPDTGRKKSKSTKVERTGRAKDRKEAERVAAKSEAELQEGRYHEPLLVTWSEFRTRYEIEKLPSLAKRTDGHVAAVFNWVEKALNPSRLADPTESRPSWRRETETGCCR